MAKRFLNSDVNIKLSKSNCLLISLKLNKFGGSSTAHALQSSDTNVNVGNVTTLSYQLHCFVAIVLSRRLGGKEKRWQTRLNRILWANNSRDKLFHLI